MYLHVGEEYCSEVDCLEITEGMFGCNSSISNFDGLKLPSRSVSQGDA